MNDKLVDTRLNPFALLDEFRLLPLSAIEETIDAPTHPDDFVPGGPGNDTLFGTVGDDTIDGAAGADSMSGGAGNDTYIVDNAGDKVNESANEGTDTVLSSVTYTLAKNVENLTLAGTGNINGTGNASNNVLTGNAGNNKLNGAAGADTMVGGAGNDTYTVDNVGDLVTEGVNAGNDTVIAGISYTLGANLERLTLSGTADLNGTGNASKNTLTGNGGNNVLDGGAGADTMSGGGGDDSYVVDNAGDLIVEASGGGMDTVASSVSLTLAAEVENLTLTTAGDINATGNGLANLLTGNSGNNTLDGGGGADTLAGGAGDDFYAVDSVNDVILEFAGQGIDTVLASATIVLAAEVERLTLTGSDNIGGTGNASDNLLTGNAGNNSLSGAGGNDTLDGGVGVDSLDGGSGDDVFLIDNSADAITELAGGGTDTAFSAVNYALGNEVERLTLTGSANLSGAGNGLANLIIGNSGANSLSGAGGNDTLDGGLGADTLAGGANADTYIVDNAGDLVNESAGAGTDTVQASVNYTLTTNVENLQLTGSGNLAGGGNALNNQLVGNSGNNLLDGGSGADTMAGGTGNDSYVVDAIGDVVNESSGGGTDTVNSSISYVLGNNVENLTLTGTDNLAGTGNSLGNNIVGNAGNNALAGGDGNDSFDASLGIDSVLGGNGNDSALISQGTFDGGSGKDTASIQALDTTNGYGFGWILNGSYVYAESDSAAIAGALAGGSQYLLYNNYSGATPVALSNVENINFLAGSTGSDLVFALGSGTTYDGGDGTDTFYADWSASSANITWNGSAGNGVTTTGFERFLLTTGAGNDTISGIDTGSAHELSTGAGNDNVSISLGSYIGGDGSDTANVWVADTTNGYGYGWIVNGTVVTAGSGAAGIAAALAGGSQYLLYNNYSGATPVALYDVENINFIAGSAGSDLVFALGSGTTYDGGAGTDTFYADWSASSANITWNGSAGNGVTTTGFERFLLTTGAGNDTISGIDTGSAHELSTGAGNDNVSISLGSYIGGDGSDTANVWVADTTNGYGYGWIVNGTVVTAGSGAAGIAAALAGGSQYLLYNNYSGATPVALYNVENINFIAGSAGSDLVFALGSGTTYDGGAGTDTFYADWSASTSNIAWNGSAGNGVTTTGFERFLLTTGAGNDTISGIDTGSAHELSTGAGNDNVSISLGSYIGGDGSDTANVWVADTTNGYGYGWIVNGTVVTAGSGAAGIAAALAGGSQYLLYNNYSGATPVALYDVENINFIAGSAGSDLVFALGSGTTYDGGAGTDTFYADWSASTSNITWNGSAGNGVTTTAFERFLLTTGAGNDTISGIDTGSAHELSTGAGNDNVSISLGSYIGGDGSDTANVWVADTTNGYGYGWIVNGTVVTAGSGAAGIAAALAGGSQYLLYNNYSGATPVALYNVENINFIAGSAGSDLVFALGSGTTYDGGAGVDTFYANWSTSTGNITWVNNPTTAQTVNGASVSGLERLLLTTGSGNDTIDNSLAAVGATNDEITTGNGNDSINGGAGNDVMIGGNGNDTYTVDSTGDVVVEASGAGTGSDTVRAIIDHALAANVEKLVLLGSATINGDGNSLANALTGSSGANILRGFDGNDTLSGGAGNDTLTGGAGADSFFFDTLIGSDLITDFASGLDKMNISRASLPIGDGDALVEGAQTLAGPGGFLASAELVVVTGDIAGSITAASAASAIGNASSAYAIGQSALFVVDNGTDSAVYLFKALDANASVSAAELSLLSTLQATSNTVVTDYLFVS